MLRVLRIQNLAVIESVEVAFDPGFNALTGETGAGKSILVEAVGLLLGSRASSDLVRTGAPQATIEATFDDGEGPPIVVKREITPQGRSRSFVNGALATAGALRELSARLVELHGQHEHQMLLDVSTHLPLLDVYADLSEQSAIVAARFASVRRLREQLDRSRMDVRERATRLDLIELQLNEIERAAPKPAEDEDLAVTRHVLGSAERIKRLCEECYTTLYEADHAVLASLGQVWKRLTELASLDPRFAEHASARDGIKFQLEDLALFIRRYADDVDASPERLQQVEDRLALLERLKRKHGPTIGDVIEKGAALRRERDLLTESTGTSDRLPRELTEATDAYLVEARILSRARRAAGQRFAAEMEVRLAELAMERARFAVRFNEVDLQADGWHEGGIDQAEFFVSPNPGEDLRPLTRVVSGGELSRLMLALKTMRVGEGPKTLVFDEVDAGIGGRVADVVGLKLRQLADQAQVLCITHLPQIAARATTQFRIEKIERGRRTVTNVEHLDAHGRVEEIARMIGGQSVTDAVRAGARELLAGARAKGKETVKGESESRRRG